MPRRTDISFILIIGAGPLALLLASTSCAQGDSTQARAAELTRIADACGLPRASLTLHAGQVRFQPPLDARYEAVDCALTRLRQSGLVRDIPMGFVGNEAPEVKADNAQTH
jgi:hypothetical protein